MQVLLFKIRKRMQFFIWVSTNCSDCILSTVFVRLSINMVLLICLPILYIGINCKFEVKTMSFYRSTYFLFHFSIVLVKISREGIGSCGFVSKSGKFSVTK